MTPEQIERVKWLDKEDAKEKRRELRALTYSPGEQMWMGFTIIFAILLYIAASI